MITGVLVLKPVSLQVRGRSKEGGRWTGASLAILKQLCSSAEPGDNNEDVWYGDNNNIDDDDNGEGHDGANGDGDDDDDDDLWCLKQVQCASPMIQQLWSSTAPGVSSV